MSDVVRAIREQVASLPDRQRRDLVIAVTSDLRSYNDCLHAEAIVRFRQDEARAVREVRRRGQLAASGQLALEA